MRNIAVVLTVALLAGFLTVPAFAQTASPNTPSTTNERALSGRLRAIDHRLDATIRALKAAEQIADRLHLRGSDAVLDQGLGLARAAEEKADQALAMVRAATAEGAKPSREQLERVARVVDEALKLTHQAEEKIDVALKNHPQDVQRLGKALKFADRNADAASRMLRRLIERL